MRDIIRGVSCFLAASVLAATAGAGEIDAHWSLVKSEPSSYEAALSLVQESPDTIADEHGANDVRPVLDIRCSIPGSGTLTLQIDWRRFISSFNTEVGFRVDSGKATWLKMGVDSSNRITVSKSAGDAAKLLELLESGQTLTVEVAPYSEPSVFVKFDVSTFATALTQLEDACI